jgi:hypothetical protein
MNPMPGLKYKMMDFRPTLADETGEEWDTDPRTFSRPTKGNGFSMVTPWNFPSFPRRGRTLRFRLYAHNDLDKWDTLVDFTLPNPLPGRYPVWTAPRLPNAQSEGDVQVSLVGLVTGTKAFPYDSGIRPFTRATFEVKKNGQPVAWVPDRLMASDATGNEATMFMVDARATNTLVYFEMQGTSLSPSEVWRVRARFPWPGKPLWTSPELPVQAGSVLPMNLSTNAESLAITLASTQSSFPNTIALDVGQLPANAKVSSDIVDDRGGQAKYKSGFFSDSGFDVQWEIPSGAKWLKVSVSLVKTHDFEFLAQPVALTRTNQ